MLLYNQTRKPLSWDAGGKAYKWDPFGTCDVPVELVSHLRAQKVPVDVTPVAPQAKAAQVVEDQRSATRKDEVHILTEALRVARDDVATAKATVEEAESRRAAAEAKAVELRTLLDQEVARTAQLEADLRACDQLLTETSRKLDAVKNIDNVMQAAAGLAPAAAPVEPVTAKDGGEPDAGKVKAEAKAKAKAEAEAKAKAEAESKAAKGQ